MKVVCIDDTYSHPNRKSSTLTKGKIYSVLYEHFASYQIINDKNQNDSYIKERFITIQEYRSKKLEKLLK